MFQNAVIVTILESDKKLYGVTKLLVSFQLENILRDFNLDKSLSAHFEANLHLQKYLNSNLAQLRSKNFELDKTFEYKFNLISLIESFAQTFTANNNKLSTTLSFIQDLLSELYKDSQNPTLVQLIDNLQKAIKDFILKNQIHHNTHNGTFMEICNLESQQITKLYKAINTELQKFNCLNYSFLNEISKDLATNDCFDSELKLGENFSLFSSASIGNGDFNHKETENVYLSENYLDRYYTSTSNSYYVIDEDLEQLNNEEDEQTTEIPSSSQNTPVNLNFKNRTWTDEECVYLYAGYMLYGTDWTSIIVHFKNEFIFGVRDRTHISHKFRKLKQDGRLNEYKEAATRIYEQNKHKFKKARHLRKSSSYSDEEISHLLAGVKMYGNQYARIFKHFEPIFKRRKNGKNLRNFLRCFKEKKWFAEKSSDLKGRIESIYRENLNKKIENPQNCEEEIEIEDEDSSAPQNFEEIEIEDDDSSVSSETRKNGEDIEIEDEDSPVNPN